MIYTAMQINSDIAQNKILTEVWQYTEEQSKR